MMKNEICGSDGPGIQRRQRETLLCLPSVWGKAGNASTRGRQRIKRTDGDGPRLDDVGAKARQLLERCLEKDRYTRR